MLRTVFGPSSEEYDRIERELMSDTVKLKVTMELGDSIWTFEEDVPKVALSEASEDIYYKVHDWFREGGVWETVNPVVSRAVEARLRTGQPDTGWRSAVAAYRMYPDGSSSLMETYYLPDTDPREMEDRTKEWLENADFKACRVGCDWERDDDA